MATRFLNRWVRDLHLYTGLFLSPVIVVFALSVIFLNHTWLPWGGQDGTEAIQSTDIVTLPDAETDLELAKVIQAQLDLPGEIDFINRNEATQTLSFPITAPGYRTMIRIDLASGAAAIQEQRTGLWDAMNYLHKMPGPHNVSVRGNWVGTRVWGWVADVTVYLLLFISATGVYLWTLLRSERKAGLLFLGGGALSFFLIILAIVG